MNMLSTPARALTADILDVSKLDWANEAVWVARAEALEVEGDGTTDPVVLKTAAGARVQLTQAALRGKYAEISPGRWRSFFSPVRAVPVQTMCVCDLGEGMTVVAQAGEAVIKEEGRYWICSALVFDREYKVVGHPGSPRPLLPFTYY